MLGLCWFHCNCNILTSSAINGEEKLPIRAHIELDPMPKVLATVGNSSAEYTYIIAKLPDITILPIREQMMIAIPYSKTKNTHLQSPMIVTRVHVFCEYTKCQASR